MTTLYLSDLDGTLLGPDERLSSKTSDVVTRFVRGGGLFSFSRLGVRPIVFSLIGGVERFSFDPAGASAGMRSFLDGRLTTSVADLWMTWTRCTRVMPST